jgi:putative PIN family toxin of toxin-antitoxin system
MIYAVVDTSVLLSALWNKDGSSAVIVAMALRGELTMCVNYEIMREYRKVLTDDRFGFSSEDVVDLLARIEAMSYIVAVKSSVSPFIDESNRKFYDVAKACKVTLITENKKHHPNEPFIMTVDEF